LIWLLSPVETPLGVELNPKAFCQLLYDKVISPLDKIEKEKREGEEKSASSKNRGSKGRGTRGGKGKRKRGERDKGREEREKEPVSTETTSKVTVVWTGDYGKKPKITFGGFSFPDVRFSAASSSYHFMSTAFYGEESAFNYRTNCPDTLQFLNSDEDFLDCEGGSVLLRKEVLVDLSCAKILLGIFTSVQTNIPKVWVGAFALFVTRTALQQPFHSRRLPGAL